MNEVVHLPSCLNQWPISRTFCSGQALPHHPKADVYRCYLPILAGFTGFRRVEPVLHYFRNRLVPPTRSSGRNSTRPRGFADNRGPRALRLARQRRGRDSNSRSFRIRTFQARAIDQLGDLSRNPTRGVKSRAERVRFELTRHAINAPTRFRVERFRPTQPSLQNKTARLRGLEPLATRSAIWCSIQTELRAQIRFGERGI